MGLRRSLAVVVALAVFVAVATGCRSGGSGSGPVVTVPEAPSTTASVDPYAVPAIIDEAYVNRVLAALDAAVDDVVRLVVKTRTFPPEAYDRLKAIYGDAEWLQLRLDGFQDDLSNGLRGYQHEPGNERTTVSSLLTATPECIFARVNRDASRMVDTSSTSIQWVALKRMDTKDDVRNYNPTQLGLVYDGFQRGGTDPSNPCTAAS